MNSQILLFDRSTTAVGLPHTPRPDPITSDSADQVAPLSVERLYSRLMLPKSALLSARPSTNAMSVSLLVLISEGMRKEW